MLSQAFSGSLDTQAAAGEQVFGAAHGSESHRQPRAPSTQTEKKPASLLVGSRALSPHCAAQLSGRHAAAMQIPPAPSEQAWPAGHENSLRFSPSVQFNEV
jgi:hypothetical protein